jgi:hypothetical protein
MGHSPALEIVLPAIPAPLLVLALVLVLGLAIHLISDHFATLSRQYEPPSLQDIADEEARRRAQARLHLARAEEAEALIKSETAETSLRDIRQLLKNERKR